LAALLAATAVISIAAPAWAQERNAAPAADSAGSDQAIVVTATKRASPLSDVPIAVSAVTGQSMALSGASDIRQLNQLAPSLMVYSTVSEAAAVARIRGVGTVGDNPGLESSVGVFIDGVYRSRTGAGFSELGELERVEVLRGPQGTLFGRNTSAGLINIVTKQPEFKLGANGEISYGNYDYWRLAGRVTGPLSDKVAASIDGVFVSRDGFLHMVDATGNRIGDTNDRNRYLLRGQLLIEPTDDLSIRLIADYTHRNESCCGAVYTDVTEETGSSPQTAVTSATNRIVTILQNLGTVFPNGSTPYVQDPYERNISITPGREYVSRLRDWGLSGEVNYELDSGIKLTSITAYRDYKSSDYGDYDYGTADLVYRNPDTYREFKTFSQELRAQGKAFGDKLDWLVGAYYAHEDLTLEDNIDFGADYGRFAACRLMAGSAATSALTPAQLSACSSLAGTNLLIAGTQAALAAKIGAAMAATLGDGLRSLAAIPSGTGDVHSRYFQKSENWALFTHNIVHVASHVDLTLGLRYTHESKALSTDFDNNNATCPQLQASGLPALAFNPALGSAATLAGGILTLGCLGNASTSLNTLALNDRISDGELSGTAVLSWKATDRLMLYASYARGYKSGGYNLDRFELGNTGLSPNISPITFFSPRSDADAASLRFGAEKVNAYELGAKFAMRGLSANLALFREEFSNFQLNTFNGTSFIVQNINGCNVALSATGTCSDVAAGLVSQGVEVELSASPIRDVRLNAGLTYADTKFNKRLVGSADGTIPLDPALFLLPGQRNSNAPAVVATGSIAWTPPIGSNGLSGLVYVDGRVTSSYNTGSDLYPEKNQDGYGLVNARIGLHGPDQRWAVELWAQNLFDQGYTQVTINSPLQSTGPNNQSVAQLGLNGAVMTNQLFSAFLGEPRTYGVTLKGRF
jgi:outer membrane receptor protein involved in Fe transport